MENNILVQKKQRKRSIFVSRPYVDFFRFKMLKQFFNHKQGKKVTLIRA